MPLKTNDQQLGKNYDRAAWFYEKSAKIYSTNQIRASKRHQLNYIHPEQKVLFLGAGAGEDAVMAAEAGAKVTCIDISQGMLNQVQRKLDAKGLEVELICENAFSHDRFDHYDVVAANYFLNVFRLDGMTKMLNHTAQLVRPGGRYLIADVARSQGNPLSQAFNIVYLKLGMIAYWALGMVPLHKNYDYIKHFPDAGLTFEHSEFFRLAKKGPVLFQSIAAKREPTKPPSA
jgi:demethylmenaquinone methyltransferase/2-methoxy-6-polyprenyl-1,4-benzoquinol methylase